MEKIFFTSIFLFMYRCIATWNYVEQQKWGKTCLNGVQQSPIALPQNIDAIQIDESLFMQVITTDKNITTFVDTHDKNLLSTGYYSNLTATIEGQNRTFISSQFHLHYPSEHEINGKQYDLQLHFVHMNNDDQDLKRKISVIGVLFEVFDDHEFQNGEKTFFDQWKFQVTLLDFNFNFGQNFGSLLQDGYQFINYNGSLTTPTPDCIETVNWFVYTQIQQVKRSQYEQIIEELRYIDQSNDGQNNRYIQPLFQRQISIVKPQSTPKKRILTMTLNSIKNRVIFLLVIIQILLI